MKNTISILLLVVIFLLSSRGFSFPRNSLKPGGIAIIPVSSVKNNKPKVSYNSHPVALIKGSKNWLAIIGISLKAKLGTHTITISEKLNGKNIKTHKSFKVKRFPYKTQRLTIKNKNKVNPNKMSQERIEKEFFLKKKLKSTFTNQAPHLNFVRPTSGRDSGRFGLRRILNKQKRNPHSGMDIAAPLGRPVKAVESGRVLFVGDLFFTGNAIYIDHGNGLISLYAHLNRTRVKKGQIIKRGQVIGNVGKTGRATGAHLHWSVYLNGNAVDPALFLNKN